MKLQVNIGQIRGFLGSRLMQDTKVALELWAILQLKRQRFRSHLGPPQDSTPTLSARVAPHSRAPRRYFLASLPFDVANSMNTFPKSTYLHSRFFLQDYATIVAGRQDHLLLDVRARVQFAVCALDGAVNIPLAELEVRATLLRTVACC